MIDRNRARPETASGPTSGVDRNAQLHAGFYGVARPWHCSMLYNREPRFARVLMALLKREDRILVGDNEPYSVTDAMDYTIPVHASDAACSTSRLRFARI